MLLKAVLPYLIFLLVVSEETALKTLKINRFKKHHLGQNTHNPEIKTRHNHGENSTLIHRDRVRNKLFLDRQLRIAREKRGGYSYIGEDGVVHYVRPFIPPCSGVGFYNPYRCTPCKCIKEPCRKPCTNHQIEKPPPPSIYSGVGRYWIGPRAGCNCNSRGSELPTCDITTGQCRCRPFYTGRTCDKCQDGFWETNNGCIECQCDPDGSRGEICNQRTGQCDCKVGVGGLQCDICLSGFFGFCDAGCKVCDPCNKKGHICDPDTGGCVCPPYSHGEFCHICSANSWGYEPNKGCKQCNCSQSGSTKMQCNSSTGECTCKLGYAGGNCNRCAHGYFGYPRCRRCNCNLAGTDRHKAQCDNNGICQCNEDGQCPCKINVFGLRCEECTDGTFSLQAENPDGCTQCFCFGRSSKCTEAGLTWGQIRLNASRALSINSHRINKHKYLDDVEHSGKLLVIPEIYGNVTIEKQHFGSPLYWRLHPIFEGDRVLSYGGYLRFTTDTISPFQRLPQDILNHYPLVQLRSHGRIVLEYYPLLPNLRNLHEVRLHESLWKRIFPKDTHLSPRELLMIALQNVEGIYIKASDFSEFESLNLQDVILDTAIEVPGNPPPLARGVEICECPRPYNLTSCQSPSIGFFRYYSPTSVNGTILIDTLVGQAHPCECNGRSDICDVETGYCLNCKNYTAGRYCDKCEEGYYGNPMEPSGRCEPCPCPSPTQNFAKDCRRISKPSIHFVCKCKPGYSGPKCDECSSGYFGQPKLPQGSCKPCNCNVQGRASDECDAETGQCNCKPGVIGLQCTQCVQPRYVLQQYKCAPCDNCTQWLLDDMDWMTNELRINTVFLEGNELHPPWEVLKLKENSFTHLNNKLTNYLNNLDTATNLYKDSSLNEMQKQIRRMQNSLAIIENRDIFGKGIGVGLDSSTLLNQINANKENLQSLINTLDNFGKSHISTKEALDSAKEIMRQIDIIANQLNYPHNEVLQKCIEVKQIVDLVMNTSSTNSDNVKEEMEKLKSRIINLEEILMDIQLVNNEVDMKNKGNELAKLNDTVNLMITTKTGMLDDLKQTERLLNDTSKNINAIRNVHKLMKEVHLDNLSHELEKRISNMSTIEYDNILYKTLQHVLLLEKNASSYMMAFNLSRRDIDVIKASEAYTNINNYINEAKELALEANKQLHNALNTLLPAKKDPLAVNASISNFDSERLEIRIKNLEDKLEGIRLKQNNLTIQVNNVDANIWRNGLKNRAQDSKLRNERNKVNKQSKENMEKVIKDIFKETNRIKDIHRKLMDLNTTKEYELKRPFYRLLNLTTSDKLNEIEKKIGSIPTQLKKVFSTNFTFVDAIKEHGIPHGSFQNASLSIAEKLNALKAQIQKARQSVEGMRMSLSGLSCSRSYLMQNMYPSLSTSLEVTFNYTPTFQSNNSLFYVSADNNQFLHLFVSNSKLGFKWNMGKKENTMQTDIQLQNDFYTIFIERILNHISMKIRYKGKYIFDRVIEQKPVEDGNVMFNFNPSNLIHIGSSPDTPNGIPGCIKDVILNKQKIGLWNYIKSSGNCSSCVRQSEVLENAFDFFNGQSYFNVSRELQRDSQSPTRFYVHFVLRTFDENALLFLAPEEQQKRGYLSVSLEDGRIKYQVFYNKNQKPLTLLTEQKYNNGEKVYISVKKFYDKSTRKDIARLHVANETLEDETTVNPSSILKLGTVNFYFGGIPSDFNFELHGISKQPLLGGLEEIAGHQTFNLDNTDKNIRMYGIEKRSGELEFKQVLFEGKGVLVLKTIPINNKLLFLVRTTSTNSFIMQLNEDFRIVIEEGQLHVISLQDSYALHSGQMINDNKYYLIEVEVKKNITLKINGKLLDSKHYEDWYKLAESKVVLGGLMDSNIPKFAGLISNLIIDNHVIYFNKSTVRDFEKVKIGHTAEESFRIPTNLETFNNIDNESQNTTNPFNIKDMQNTESCGSPFTYSLDPDAAKFGDKPNSYVLRFLKDLFWRKDYTLELKFRTLHSNGLLFIALGPKQHFTSLEVANGKVLFKVYGKRQKELSLPQKVDDGRWHTVVATKKKRKLTLQVDDKNKSVKIPKNNVLRELYIGGVAENVSLPDSIGEEFRSFHGCIKGLAINNIAQSLVKDEHYNIGQCFPNIEEGAFFGGDSYSIYKKYFQIENNLELSFDFRTTEQNGILFSVSNPENKPALSLELQNGAVVLTTHNGYSISSVTNNLSDFVLCNNNWHNVTAVYSTSEITVNVDGIRKSWVQPDTENLMSELEAPLYIGGLSDSVPVGTLKMKENFKGCMKNFRINNRVADWLDMEKLHNVRLDSCPVVT